MAHPVVITPRLEAAMKRIRPVALAIPGVVEKISHGGVIEDAHSFISG